MIPVYQTINDEFCGDCFSACVASILEQSLHEVPNFAAVSALFDQNLSKYLRARGFFYLSVKSDGFDGRDKLGYHIIIGDTSSGILHCCVGNRDQIIHDPSPRGRGLDIIHEIGLIIPEDPSRYITAQPWRFKQCDQQTLATSSTSLPK